MSDSAAAIEIDGSDGEGGGQIFRLSIGLSAVTGRSVHNHSVRANRPKPGLALQHVACARAVQLLCDASVEGAVLKSPRVLFKPASIRGGNFSVDVGSQGSCVLVVQAVLPAMAFAPAPATMTINGGTHVSFAPPYQALHYVILPIIRRCGVNVVCECPTISLYRKGPPPARLGRLVLRVTPSQGIVPLHLLQLGTIVSVHCWCVSDAGCSVAASDALAACAAAAAVAFSGCAVTKEAINSDEVAAAGSKLLQLSASIGICVVSSTGCVLGADRMLLEMQPNVEEQAAARTTDCVQQAVAIVEEVAAAVRAGACVDHHMCDQLPIFMSMANGPSRIRVQPLSEHARSACAVASQFTGAVFHVEDDTNGCVVLSCTPPPKSTQIDGAAGGVARAQAK